MTAPCINCGVELDPNEDRVIPTEDGAMCEECYEESGGDND